MHTAASTALLSVDVLGKCHKIGDADQVVARQQFWVTHDVVRLDEHLGELYEYTVGTFIIQL